MPSTNDFEIVEGDVPTPADREVLVRTEYLSVDPYMRGRMRATTTYHEPWAVGEVLEGGSSERWCHRTTPTSPVETSPPDG